MLTSERNGGVLTLTIDRPEVRNALSGELMSQIDDAMRAAEADAGVRVVVVTGRGSAFSAGADLTYMRKVQAAGAEGNRKDALEMGGLFHRIASFPKPVVARVNGPAIGGGVGLMAACDVVVAASSAFFAFSEVRLGLVPAVISPFCIRRLGAATARRLFLTGQRIDAAEAARLGLVDEVVAAEGLDAKVGEVVAELRKGGPCAQREAKELVDAVCELPLDRALEHTAALIARLRASEEAQEGMRAFLEKTPASWTKN